MSSQIDIVVVPNARQTKIVGEHGDRIKLKIHAPPVDGKANEEVIRFFSDLFGVPKSRVRILRGLRSKQKTIAVSGITQDHLQKEIRRNLLQPSV